MSKTTKFSSIDKKNIILIQNISIYNKASKFITSKKCKNLKGIHDDHYYFDLITKSSKYITNLRSIDTS